MGSNNEKAVAAHATGLNCAQSVITTYAGQMNYDANLAESITAGFGSGMGRLQETCGAVTGAFMVLSIHVSQEHPAGAERKAATIEAIQEFNRRFTAIHGTKSCRLLLGCDMNTEEGRAYYKEHHLTENVCNHCIADAVTIVDELIEVQ